MNVPSDLAFVGREPELERLRAALQEARLGRTTTVVIGGEAGVGKTRLIEHFASEAGDAGAFVVIGGCPPSGESEIPFAPIVEALRTISRRLSQPELDVVFGPAGPALGRLLPTKLPEEGHSPTDGRTALFEAFLGAIERLAEARGLVILVLEDLHWADRSTRELWAYVVHNLRDASALLVATYRADDLRIGHPLRILLAELDRSVHVGRYELGRFAPAEVRAQIDSILGTERLAVSVESIAARSDGNPYFVDELVGMLRRGHTEALPDSLREMLRIHLAGLPPAVDQVLRICAAVGSRVDHRLLATLAPIAPGDLSLVLRDAVDRHLLATISDEDGDAFVFRRTLLREVIYEDLMPDERRRYHRAIASVLQEHPEYTPGPPAVVSGVIAQHWQLADSPANALSALIHAGREAMAAFAFPEAAGYFDHALGTWDAADRARLKDSNAEDHRIGFRLARKADDPEHSDGHGWRDERHEVIRMAAEAMSLSGEPARAVALTRALLEETPSADPAITAIDLLHLGQYLADDGDLEGSLSTYLEASGLAPAGSVTRARLGAARAGALVGAGKYREARAAAEEALAAATAADSDSIARMARRTLGVALSMDGDVEAGLALLAEVRQTTGRAQRTSVIRPRPSRIGDLVRGMTDHAAILDRAGRPTEFALATAEGVDVARQLGVEATSGTALAVLEARRNLQRGAWDEADRQTRELLAVGSGRHANSRLHIVRALLDTGRGSFDDAAAHLDAARDGLERTGDPAVAADLAFAEADLAIWRSQLTEARAVVDVSVGRLHQAEDQRPIIPLAWQGVRAEADRIEGARARRATTEVNEASDIAGALRAEVIALVSRLAGGATSATRELVLMPALVEAEWSRIDQPSDPEAWAEASRRADDLGDPFLAGYGRWREAEAALLGRDGRLRGAGAARTAYDLAVRLGAEPLRREVEALARRARIELSTDQQPARPPDRATAQDTLGLTEREVEVLGLVALGYTNRRIAETLFITEKTASHHVSNVLGKLGVANRMGAAAVAHRVGLLDEVDTGTVV